MTSANLKARTVSYCRIKRGIRVLQHDEYCADHDTLEASSKNGVRNDRERLVDNHVRQEESHEEEVAILPDGLDFLCIAFLFTVRYIRGVRRASKGSSDANSRCSADAQDIQLGLIQTHVS